MGRCCGECFSSCWRGPGSDLARVQRVSKKAQLAISTLAFAVWVFSLGGPFQSFSWYNPFYGSVLLPLYTFGISALKVESPVPSGS